MADREAIERSSSGYRVGQAGAWSRVTLRVVLSLAALLALRWPVPLVLSSMRGESTVDATVGAFLVSFALGVLGLPGFLAALWEWRRARGGAIGWWIRAGLLSTLASTITTAAWIVISVQEIGSTLGAATIVAHLVPLGVTAASSIALRIHVSHVTEE